MTRTDTEIYFDTGTTRVRVQYLAPNAVRVTHAPLGTGAFPPERPWLRHVLPPPPAVAPEAARLVVDTRNACARAGIVGDHIVKA